ncbi:hypothetical protein Cadr_000006513 [Camelus dromedarius]|uniref:Uncharacterized protein n=1 Tax=Camelus dromedarius TaxID=9838 RepID=A0A5N4E2U3_CAMDR|nr:hypothetical protein Cadr_000006513 [Camelus dromedarius]
MFPGEARPRQTRGSSPRAVRFVDDVTRETYGLLLSEAQQPSQEPAICGKEGLMSPEVSGLEAWSTEHEASALLQVLS